MSYGIIQNDWNVSVHSRDKILKNRSFEMIGTFAWYVCTRLWWTAMS